MGLQARCRGGGEVGLRRCRHTSCIPKPPPCTAAPSLLIGEGIEAVLSLVRAVPVLPAAAPSAGSLAAFLPLPGAPRLLIACDRDADAKGHRAGPGCARPPDAGPPGASPVGRDGSLPRFRRVRLRSAAPGIARQHPGGGRCLDRGRATRPRRWNRPLVQAHLSLDKARGCLAGRKGVMSGTWRVRPRSPSPSSAPRSTPPGRSPAGLPHRRALRAGRGTPDLSQRGKPRGSVDCSRGSTSPAARSPHRP